MALDGAGDAIISADPTLLDAVAGGAGFVAVNGVVTLDLATAHVFHQTMTGDITTFAFSNLPNADEFAIAWRWVLKIDSVGGYALPIPANRPTVTWVDGSSFDDLDMSADAVNQVAFWNEGAEVFAALVWNGGLALDSREMSFAANGTIVVPMTRAESLDVANDVVSGDGTITYQRTPSGGSIGSITTRTDFAAGDVLTVTCSGTTGPTGVSIPRYAA